MAASLAPLLDAFSVLSDQTRVRMLAVLERNELTVTELCAVLQLPQSTVSRHLKTLADADWVVSRRDGTSRYYSLSLKDDAETHVRLWEITRGQLADRPALKQDERRLAAVLARRSESSQKFFATAARDWDRLREELFGREFVTGALIGLVPESWVIGDLGCGTGATLPILAPHVRQVIGVDASEEMLAAARERTQDLPNVDLRPGALESLPIESGTLDAATLILVLHHLAAPADALAEARRVLKPGGRLLIVDMTPHEHEEYRHEMGHVWLGFSSEHMQRLLGQAGFEGIRIHMVPPGADAKGPGLFVGKALKPSG